MFLPKIVVFYTLMVKHQNGLNRYALENEKCQKEIWFKGHDVAAFFSIKIHDKP